MKLNIRTLTVILGLMLGGCANTFQYTKMAEPSSADQEMATIYIIRPNNFASAIKFGVYQDEKLIGRLGPKSYLAWNVKTEGKEISIKSKSETTSEVLIRPEPGKTYYIRQRVEIGIAIDRPKLERIDENEGKELLKEVKAPRIKNAE